MHKKVILKNGLRVILAPRHETKAVTAIIGFHVGSRNETEDIAGISHFFEHMAFKGTTKRKTPIEVSKYIDSIGGQHNAFTSKEMTGYWAKVAAENLEQALDFLSDNQLNSTYPEPEVEKERGVILEEIKMYEDMPIVRVEEYFENIAFASDPLSRDISGYPRVIEVLKRDDFIRYKERHYYPENAVICISGNFGGKDESEVAKLIERYFPFKDKNKPLNPSTNIEGSDSPSKLVNKKTEQSNLIIGYRAPGIEDENVYVLEVLAKILGGSASSRMFETIREKMGLCWAIDSFYHGYFGAGYIATSTGVANKKIEQATEAIISEYQKMTEVEVTDEELNRAKAKIKASIIISAEDSEKVGAGYMSDELILGRIYEPEEEIKKITAVTKSDILDMARKIFDRKKLLIAAIGPDVAKLEKYLNK